MLDDGSLFFSKIGVHHMGNYSCEDSTDPSVLQVHSLKVQSKFIDSSLCVLRSIVAAVWVCGGCVCVEEQEEGMGLLC